MSLRASRLYACARPGRVAVAPTHLSPRSGSLSEARARCRGRSRPSGQHRAAPWRRPGRSSRCPARPRRTPDRAPRTASRRYPMAPCWSWAASARRGIPRGWTSGSSSPPKGTRSRARLWQYIAAKVSPLSGPRLARALETVGGSLTRRGSACGGAAAHAREKVSRASFGVRCVPSADEGAPPRGSLRSLKLTLLPRLTLSHSLPYSPDRHSRTFRL